MAKITKEQAAQVSADAKAKASITNLNVNAEALESVNLELEYNRSNFHLKQGYMQMTMWKFFLSWILCPPLAIFYTLYCTFTKKDPTKNTEEINDVDKKRMLIASIALGVDMLLYIFIFIYAGISQEFSNSMVSLLVIAIIVHIACGFYMLFRTQWWADVSRKADKWSRKTEKRRKFYLNKTLYAMMIPYLIIFIIFTVAPVLISFLLGFTYFNLLEFPTWVGFNNYLTLFLDDPIFITAVENTVIIAVICGPGGYLMSFAFAWLINEVPDKIRPIITLVFYAPSICGGGISIWTLIFSSDIYGYANAFLIEWGFITEPINWLQNAKYILPIVIVVQLWMSLGVNFLTMIAGLKGVPRDQYEAAAVDGIRNRWQELWYITLPNMKSQLLFSAVLQISSSLGVGAVTTSLCGFPSVQYAGHTIVNHLQDYGSVRYEMGYASAIATVLFVAGILLNKLIQKLIRRIGS